MLMLRVCQGRVSPLDGVTAACCPKPLLQLASLCCSLRPEVRPPLPHALVQLQGPILRAVDEKAEKSEKSPPRCTAIDERSCDSGAGRATTAPSSADGRKGARRPTTPLAGWQQAARDSQLARASAARESVSRASGVDCDDADAGRFSRFSMPWAAGDRESAAGEDDGGDDAALPEGRPSRLKLGAALFVAGLLVGAALLAGLLRAPAEAESGEEGENSGADGTRRAWSLGLVGAMASALLIGGCTVAASSPTRRARPPMAAPVGTAGGDDESSFGYDAMAEPAEPAGGGLGSATPEGCGGTTMAGLAAPVLPAPTCVQDGSDGADGGDGLFSDLSRFMQAVPFSRLTSMEEHDGENNLNSEAPGLSSHSPCDPSMCPRSVHL